MFLRIVNVYLILKHSQWKPKPFGIKINLDLGAAMRKRKLIVSCPNSYADVIITHIDFFEISTKQTLKSWRNLHLTKIKSFFHSILIESTSQLQK